MLISKRDGQLLRSTILEDEIIQVGLHFQKQKYSTASLTQYTTIDNRSINLLNSELIEKLGSIRM